MGVRQCGDDRQARVADGGDGRQLRPTVRPLDRAARLRRSLTGRHDAQGGVFQRGLQRRQGRAGQKHRPARCRDALSQAVVAQLDGVKGDCRRGEPCAAGGQDAAFGAQDHEGGFGGQGAGLIQGGGGLTGGLGQCARAGAQGQGGAIRLGLDLRGGQAGLQRQSLDAGGFGFTARTVRLTQHQQSVGGQGQGDGERQDAHPGRGSRVLLVRGPAARPIAAPLCALQRRPPVPIQRGI